MLTFDLCLQAVNGIVIFLIISNEQILFANLWATVHLRNYDASFIFVHFSRCQAAEWVMDCGLLLVDSSFAELGLLCMFSTVGMELMGINRIVNIFKSDGCISMFHFQPLQRVTIICAKSAAIERPVFITAFLLAKAAR